MKATETMESAVETYGATHEWFDQNMNAWESRYYEEQRGACFAVSMFWMMCDSTKQDWGSVLSASSNDAYESRKKIADVQRILIKTEASSQLYLQNNFLGKRGFAPLIVEKASSRETRSWAKYMFRENYEKSTFLHEIAVLITARPNSYALVSFTFQGMASEGHAVAARCDDAQLVFFDPNGGQLTFKQHADFQEWFAEAFPKATATQYDKAFKFDIDYYAPRPRKKAPESAADAWNVD